MHKGLTRGGWKNSLTEPTVVVQTPSARRVGEANLRELAPSGEAEASPSVADFAGVRAGERQPLAATSLRGPSLRYASRLTVASTRTAC